MVSAVVEEEVAAVEDLAGVVVEDSAVAVAVEASEAEEEAVVVVGSEVGLPLQLLTDGCDESFTYIYVLFPCRWEMI